jgi:hypothetical protein
VVSSRSLFGARFTVRKLVAANHDGNQVCDLGNRAGEEGLHRGEAGIEG